MDRNSKERMISSISHVFLLNCFLHRYTPSIPQLLTVFLSLPIVFRVFSPGVDVVGVYVDAYAFWLHRHGMPY
jgi:hypothetical protein